MVNFSASAASGLFTGPLINFAVDSLSFEDDIILEQVCEAL